jgi:hypothetical protein
MADTEGGLARSDADPPFRSLGLNRHIRFDL